MTVHRVIQGSADWFDLRCGKVTSSRVADAIAMLKRKDDEAACRRHLRTKIVSEIFTGKHSESYVSPAMECGSETEPLARTEYEMRTGRDVRLVGFVDHPTIEMAGASPDGLVDTDGCVEFKCPQSNTHIDYLIAKKAPEEYQPQMLWVMACTGAKWCDFVSFDPRMPNKHKLLIVPFVRDEQRIAAMEEGVRKFIAEVESMIEDLNAGDDVLVRKLEASIAGFGISQADTDAVLRGEL